MASPFRVFRKNVKPLLVVFGCLLILAWVGGSSLTTIMGPREGVDADPTFKAGAAAASWEGGSVTNQELDQLVMRRRIVNEFQRHVEGLGRQSSDLAGMDAPPLRVQPVIGAETPEQGVEQSVLQTKLFADAARQAGMTVDDNAIVQYLLELGRGRVTKDDMRNILQGFNSGNRRISIEYVFDGLREELLRRNYLMSNMFAAQTVTPQQGWKDWLQVNDRVIVEATALPVESYLVEVKEPTKTELESFFDECKKYEPQPDPAVARNFGVELPMAVTGLRIPRKIDVQFVQANFNELVTKTEGEVTDEEIAKYYEENKDYFIKADTGLLDDVPGTQEVPKAEVPGTESAPPSEDDVGKTDASDADAKTEETGDDQAAAETEATPATENPPSDEPAPSNPPEQTPAAIPSETPPATDEGSEPATPGEGDQSTTRPKVSSAQNVFRQVVFLQEQESDASDVAPPADATAAPGEDAATADAETATVEATAPAEEAADTAEPAAATDAATTPPASTDPATDAVPPAATDAETSPADAPPTTITPPAEKPTEYQPLEEVRDEIRRNIAYRRANEKIGTLMDEVLSELTREFEAYFDKVLTAQSNKEQRPAAPAALADLAPLAKKHGLTVGKTGPLTYLEFRETPVGKSGDPNTGFPLVDVLYRTKIRDLYQPILTVSTTEGDRYIAMKTSDTPGRVPTLSDPGVRDKVVRAWKLREAAKIALKDAEKQAAAAQKAGSSLVDFYAEKPAIQAERIDPFSYLTRGDVPQRFDIQRFRLSQPEGIVAAGPELLGKVFELKDGEVAAALNHDHSIAYVIRVVEHQDTPDELRTAYLSEATTWDGLQAMTERHTADSRDSIIANITGTDGVDWKRDPDELRDDSAEETAE